MSAVIDVVDLAVLVDSQQVDRLLHRSRSFAGVKIFIGGFLGRQP